MEELKVIQLANKIAIFFETGKFITVFTRSRHWSLFWTIHYTTSHTISLRSIVISYHLHLGLPSGLFPSCFPIKILYAFLASLMRAACPPSHSPWSHHPNNISWRVQIMKLLIVQSSLLYGVKETGDKHNDLKTMEKWRNSSTQF
jgi:hypothetical protein